MDASSKLNGPEASSEDVSVSLPAHTTQPSRDPLEDLSDTLAKLENQLYDVTVADAIGRSLRHDVLIAIWGCREKINVNGHGSKR